MSSEQLNRRNILEMDQEIIRLRRSEKKYRAEIDRLKAQLEVMHNEMERHNEYSDRLHRQLADKDKRIAELERVVDAIRHPSLGHNDACDSYAGKECTCGWSTVEDLLAALEGREM